VSSREYDKADVMQRAALATADVLLCELNDENRLVLMRWVDENLDEVAVMLGIARPDPHSDDHAAGMRPLPPKNAPPETVRDVFPRAAMRDHA
jgi:hypothetical protein